MHRRRAGGGNVAAQPAQPVRHGARRHRAREPGQPGACLRRSGIVQDRGVLGGQLHVPARAKRVIYLFMAGGPSQMETFDYKPVLRQRNGEQLPDSVRQGQRLTGMSGNQSSLPLAGSQFGFGQHGANGTWVSDLLPHTARHRGRPVHRALDVHRGDQPRSRDHVLPDRLADRRPTEHGFVDSLRPRQRQRGPAGVCRADYARQGRSAACTRASGAAAFFRRNIRACSSAAARTRCSISAIPMA